MNKQIKFPEVRFATLQDHMKIAKKAFELLFEDTRVKGLYLSGSFADGKPDIYSDIDINILVEEQDREQILKDHIVLMNKIGKIATMFPATHLNDPNQIIVFYEESVPIHVDFQYKIAKDLTPNDRNKGIIILYDQDEIIAKYKNDCQNVTSITLDIQEKLQYFEDRFWAWIAYTDAKIKRGELWEARDAIEYIRSNVILKLMYYYFELPNEGNRRLETKFPKDMLDILVDCTPIGLTKGSYNESLQGLIDGYQNLFDNVLEKNGLALEVKLADRNFFINSIR